MTIYINYDNIYCHLDGASAEICNILYESLKFHPDGYQHVYSFQNHRWDGYNRLFNVRNKQFRRGLLNRVIKVLEGQGYKVETKYSGVPPILIDHQYDFSKIRPYNFQEMAVKVGTNADMGLIVAPTGSGKTVVVSKLIAKLQRRTLVILTDIVLLDQMQQALQRYYNQTIGMIGDGEFDLQDITVSTIQSLLTFTKTPKTLSKAEDWKKFKEWSNGVGAVISDEVHLSDSESFSIVLPMFKNADKFIGTSATPYGWSEKAEKKSNIELEQHFGEVIFDCRQNNFIELGLKAPLFVSVVNRTPLNEEYNQFTKMVRRRAVPDFTKNYRDCLEKEILENVEYHHLVAGTAWDLLAKGQSVFVHAPHSIEFGEKISRLIPGAVLVNGKTPRLKRRGIYDAMRKKEQMALVSDIGGTGLDLPNLNAIIMAGDVTDIRQLSGRVERAAPDKTHGLLVDFNINTSFLSKHHSIRRYQYEHAGNIIQGE
jgi:superfamily II DNA or RNA helicase